MTIKINCIAVSNNKKNHISEQSQQYIKLLSPYAKLDMRFVMSAKRHKNGLVKDYIKIEESKILDLIPSSHYIIAMDEKGRLFRSTELANTIGTIDQNIRYYWWSEGYLKELKVELICYPYQS